MKKGLIFATTLAIALGVGVAVGAHQSKPAKVEADEGKTVYCKVDKSWWTADNAAVGAHYWGGADGTTWPGARMTAVATDSNVWKITIPAGHTSVIFTRVNPGTGAVSDWGAKTDDLTIPTDSKNLFVITQETAAWSGAKSAGEWQADPYVEPDPDVPTEGDGYYLVGTESNWKFAGAPKLDAGTDGNVAQLKGYKAEDGEEFKIRGYFDGDGDSYWYGDKDGNNCVVAERTTVDVYLNGSYEAYVYVPEDVPAEPGYYIQGIYSSVPSWRYEHAMQMVQYSQDGNVAYYMNFTCGVGDEIQVRSYFEDREEKDQWGKPGNVTEEYGEKVGDHFVISKAGYYDIYAKYVGDDFLFFVAEHAESYSISVKGVLFEGKNKLEGLVDFGEQRAYKEQVFNPYIPSYEGYVYQKAYTNEACTTEYTPAAITSGTIYLKYIKVGYYVISGAGNWKIENAVPMMTAGIGPNNKAEAAVTVATKDETYSFVYYNEEGKMSGQSGLGKEYAYAVYEESHIKFTEIGTYAVYWTKDDAADNPNKVFLNDGSTAYCTTFLSATGGVCKSDDKSEAYISSLQTVWTAQKTAYQALNDGAKAEIVKVGFDGGKEDGTDAEQLMARYHYIVCKYGSERFENFIFPEAAPIAPSAAYIEFGSINSADNTTMIIIIAVAAVSALAFSSLLIIKKRKQK